MEKKFRSRRSFVIPNGLDFSNRATRPAVSSVRDEVNVCWVGRLEPVKRVDLFLDIARHLQSIDSQYRFFVFGDGSMKEYCDRYVAGHRLGDCVRLMGFQQEMERELLDMDVMLITSDSEGLPMALLEAIAAGVVVVSRDVGGISSVIKDQDTGILVTADDYRGLAQVLIDLTADRQKMQSLCSRALTHVKAAFSAERTAECYKSVYRELLNDVHD